MAFQKLILASFRRQKSLYLLWIVSLCAAVSGLVIVDVFRQSLTSTLQLEGRKMLAADVTLSSRRALSAEEKSLLRASLPSSARFADMTEMYAMATVSGESRLSLVRFVSDEFPLIGDFQVLENGELTARTGRELRDCRCAWVAGDLLGLMNAKIGQTIRVGKSDYLLRGEIKKDSTQTFRFGNMAPRIYVHRSSLAGSQLVQYGSTLSEVMFAAVEREIPLPPLKEKLEKSLKDTSIQVTIPADLEQGSLRVLSRLLDFLGLTGLITLSLGWIGVYYLGRRWLALETLSAAVLKCIGLSSKELRNLLLLKLALILFCGVALGGIVSWFGATLLLPYFRESLPEEFSLVWSWKNTLLLLVIGPVAGLLLLYQAVRDLAFEKPLALFQERTSSRTTNLVKLVVLILLTAGLFLALTFLQARSWKVTGVFIGALTGSALVIAVLAYGFLLAVGRLRARHSGWMPHLISALWIRRPATSLLLIIVSALAGLLSQLLPHLERTLVGELSSPVTNERPSLFMVDIQDEQLDPLKDFLAKNKIEIAGTSPFVRARILAVNNESFERAQTGDWSTREEENDARFRNRGVNLSYRKDLADSENVIAGKAWKDLRIDPPEIAVEEGYAKRLRVKLGDRLKFDVQGMEIEARIAALRAVKWNSFTPNFFIQFPDGVLNDAPKTWVMAVLGKADLPPAKMQTLITRDFPNVTSINVEEVVGNMRDLIGKLSSGLKISSRLSLGLGIFVFLMIVLFQLISARGDWRQLLVLGMTRRQVWLMQVVSYGLLCLIGTLIGALMSLAVAWTLFKFAFDTRTDFDFLGMLQIWLWTWLAAFVGFGWLGLNEINRSRNEIVADGPS